MSSARRRRLEIEDYVGVRECAWRCRNKMRSVSRKTPHRFEGREITGSMQSSGRAVERPIFPRVVALGLEAATARRDVVRRLQVRRAQPREEDVLIVEVGPMRVDEVGADRCRG